MKHFCTQFLVAGALTAGLIVGASREAKAQVPGAGGFGSDPSKTKDKDDKNEILPEVDKVIGEDAQKTFDHAEKAYAKKDWLEALAYYQHVRAKFSYNVTLSSLAQLRLGDISFGREKWLEAKEYYKEFLRMHPNHPKADYAAFQMGECAYKDIPGDFFLFPSTSERDQSEVRAARNTMKDFLEQHPKSEFVPQAKEILVKCGDRLAEHELYVAQYYVTRKKWAGVVIRGEGLARQYPESTKVPEALVMAIKAHAKLRQAAEATKDPDEIQKHVDAARKDYEMLAALGSPQKVLDSVRSELEHH